MRRPWVGILLAVSAGAQTSQPPSAPFEKLAADAEAARKAGRIDAAAASYRQALRANPSWKEGWWALGGIYYQQDRHTECRDAYAKLVAFDSNSGPALTMLGLCEFRLEEYNRSLEHLRHAQEFGPGPGLEEVARYHLVKLLAKHGDFEAALSHAAALALTGKQNQAWVQAAGVAALWRNVFPEDVPPADRELVFLTGRAFWDIALRNVASAKASFAALLSKYPSAPGVNYLYGGFALVEAPDEAIGAFEKELQINPRHAGALTALAAEHLRRGEAAKAVPFAQKAAEFYPESFAVRTLYGRVLAATGDSKAALVELERARDLAPDESQPRIALASVYASLGRHEDAARERREFQRITAKKPD